MRQGQRQAGDNRLFIELVQGLVRSICLTIEVFLRLDFGSGYIGCGFMGAIFIWLFSMMFDPLDISALIDFSFVYLAVWLVATVCTLIRYWRSRNRLHSKYTGRPFLWALLSGWKEENVKHLEAVIMILLGFRVHHFNVPLGDYLMTAASMLLFRDYFIASEQRGRAVQMHDQVIEQKMVAEQFRSMLDQ